MRRLGLPAIAIVGLFVIGCISATDKPCGCDTKKTDQPASEKAKAKESETAAGDAAPKKEAPAAGEPKPKEGDASAEPAEETGPPPTEPDPAAIMDLDVDPTGPALAPPANEPDASP